MPDGDDSQRRILAAVQAEVDQALAQGRIPEAGTWTASHPELAREIEELVAFRTGLHHEGLATGTAGGDDREVVLSEFEALVQDALNRGEAPDLVGWQARHPHLAADLEQMASMAEFLRDALTGEAPSAGVRPSTDETESGLGRYRLLRRIATCAIGPVYLGEGGDPSQRVELMILRPIIPKDAAWKILHEADQTRSLAGPGFLRVVDVGEVREVRFIAWEHVRGMSLSQAVMELGFHGGNRILSQVLPPLARPVTEERLKEDQSEARAASRAAAAVLARNHEHVQAALGLGARLARLLASAHLQGRPHLDLSPGAVVIALDGRPHVRWFGLARHFRGLRTEEHLVPVYRAPELVFGAEVRAEWKADVYGTAAVLHALLFLEPPLWLAAGERPGPEIIDRAWALVAGNLKLLPEVVAPVLRRALDPDPAARPADCEALAAELETAAAALAGCSAPPSTPGPPPARPGFFKSLFTRLSRRP